MSLLQNKDNTGRRLLDSIGNWQGIVDTFTYPVYIVNPEFTIVAFNTSCTEIFGILDTPVNEKCHHVLHSSAVPCDDCPMHNVMKSGESSQTEFFIPSSEKNVLVHASPVIDNNDIVGAIHSVMDITNIERQDDSMSDLIDTYADSINEMKSREHRANRGRDAFLNMLEDINESYKDLEDLLLKLIVVMVNALDAKSPWTKGHSERVSMYAELISQELELDSDDVKNIKLAGLLHDIGKIGTYDQLLNKPGILTNDEFDVIKKHPAQGAEILKHIKQFREVIPFITYHHEKLDGKGYPNCLEGSNIPLGARIVHVADSFDSMTSDRPYRPDPGLDYALSELHDYKGSQFDSNVVDAFMKVLKKSKEWGPKLSSKEL